MRVGGPNPVDNLTRAATELNTVAGAKINMDKIALKLDVATGKSFVPDSQRWKNTSVSPNRLLWISHEPVLK
jgi:hypothetical protein